MIYLLDRFEPDIINRNGEQYLYFTFWETTEKNVKGLIANERCRSIFSRKEIINLFDAGKIQMVQVDEIVLRPYDKVILWTETKRFFVIELLEPIL